MTDMPPPRPGRLAGKVAVVTGAGSRGPGLGNGKATAILFAREGARVLCVDQVRERAEETVSVIRGEGGSAEAFAADVTRAGDCADMVADAVRRWGALHILHNNVGIESRKDLLETTETDWDKVLHVDLKSMLLATQSAARVMVERGGGSIICVSSIAALRGHGRTAYATAKAGVIGFVRSVAVQLGPKGIRVNAIAPGPVWTPMVEDLGPEARERRRRSTPLATEGTGWDVAWGAVYLASDEARWVTGQTLVIDSATSMIRTRGSARRIPSSSVASARLSPSACGK
jgi:NAD(P)-dependent dehydrogenase (short-subunit alcohol dehydrogenase family)